MFGLTTADLILFFEGLTVFLLCLSAYFVYEEFIRKRILVRARVDSVIESDSGKADYQHILDRRGLNASGQLKYPFIRTLNELILRSGQTFSIAQLAIFSLLLTLAVFFLGTYVGLVFVLSMSFGVIIGIIAPYGFMKISASRRIEKFGEQLPDAIDMIARSLRVGNPLPVTIRMVGREMQDPIGIEFMITSNELSAGRSLQQAVKNLEMRVGQDDLTILSSAIAIQVETGGNLVEILSLLANVMRARVKLRRRVNAVSAEGRISGRVLSGLPVVMFLALNFMTPSYYEYAWGDPISKYVLAGCAIWTLIGNIVISRMVNMKV